MDVDLSKKRRLIDHNHGTSSARGALSQDQTQSRSQDQNQMAQESNSPGLTPPASFRDFESAMQRQMEMMESMSQRINMMAFGFGAQHLQRAHEDTDSGPPEYESRAST
ncbi:hypothetical protein C0992_001722, partial [Termitomyces sp. T32_za158]